MARRVAGFIFREGEVADISAVLNLLWLVKRQHVQRVLLFISSSTLFFSSGPTTMLAPSC
jgi:hypothetical protein